MRSHCHRETCRLIRPTCSGFLLRVELREGLGSSLSSLAEGWRSALFVVSSRLFVRRAALFAGLGPVGTRTAVSLLLFPGFPLALSCRSSRSPPCLSRCWLRTSCVHVSRWLVRALRLASCSRSSRRLPPLHVFHVLCSSVSLRSCVAGLPSARPFAGSRCPWFTKEGWSARIEAGIKVQQRSPQGPSLRATALALNGSILCLQQLLR